MNQSNTDAIHFFYSLSFKKKHTRGVRETNALLPRPRRKKKENLGTGLARILPLAPSALSGPQIPLTPFMYDQVELLPLNNETGD